MNVLDKKDFFPLRFGGRSDFHLLGWQCQPAEAGQAVDSPVHSSTGGLLGQANTTGVADVELDRLIAEAHRSPGDAERARALQAAMTRVARLRPVLPLLVQAEGIAISRRVAWEPPSTTRCGSPRCARLNARHVGDGTAQEITDCGGPGCEPRVSRRASAGPSNHTGPRRQH